MSGASHNALLLTYGTIEPEPPVGDKVTYLGRSGNGSFSIGDADETRIIVVAVHWREGGTHHILNSASIGGISATIHGQTGHTGGLTGFGVALISAAVPTGTTANVGVSFSAGSVSEDNFAAWRLVDMDNAAPTDFDSDSSAEVATGLLTTVNMPEGGYAISAYSSSTQASGDSPSYSGITRDYSTDTGIREAGGHSGERSADASYEVRITNVSQTNSGNGLVTISWV